MSGMNTALASRSELTQIEESSAERHSPLIEPDKKARREATRLLKRLPH